MLEDTFERTDIILYDALMKTNSSGLQKLIRIKLKNFLIPNLYDKNKRVSPGKDFHV